MAKLNEAMKFLSLKQQCEELRQQLNRLSMQLAETAAERDLLAAALVDTDAFGDWLYEQDLSSTLIDAKAEVSPGVRTEGRDDLGLALDFARSRPGPG